MNQLILGNCQIQLVLGDITILEVDAIVNPANKRLILGSGVAGAIRKKGGPRIQLDCEQIGYTSTGKAVITSAGNLKAKYVIHAVGPKGGSLLAGRKLRKALNNTLNLAVEYKLRSIAIPAISTGVFGFPIKKCAYIMLKETINFVRQYQKPEKVMFCLLGDYKYSVFEKTLDILRIA